MQKIAKIAKIRFVFYRPMSPVAGYAQIIRRLNGRCKYSTAVRINNVILFIS